MQNPIVFHDITPPVELFSIYRPIHSRLVKADWNDIVQFDDRISLEEYTEHYGKSFLVVRRGYIVDAFILPFKPKGQHTVTRAKETLKGLLKYRGIQIIGKQELIRDYYPPEPSLF